MPTPANARILLPALIVPLMATVAMATSVPPKPAFRVDRDVVYGSGGGEPLKLDLYRPATPPKTPAPIVVYIHGGGWEAGSKAQGWGGAYAGRGWVFASVDYRLAPAHRFPACLEDVKAAIRYMRANAGKWGASPRRIGVWGGSAGGHLALMLGLTGGDRRFEGRGGSPAASSRVQAVVDFFGPTDLAAPDYRPELKATIARAFGTQPAALALGSPITHVRRDMPPTLIVHGKRDHVVPVSQSERLYAKLRAIGAPAELLLVENAFHSFEPESRPSAEAIEARVAAFFQRHLTGR